MYELGPTIRVTESLPVRLCIGVGPSDLHHWTWASVILVGQLAYLGVLAFCLIATAWLEVTLRTRVYRRWVRLLLTLLPVVSIFVIWDLYAIAAGHWDFDSAQTIGVVLVGGLPIEELLFFLVIPCCAILTLEAVRAVKGWPVGDEPDDTVPAGLATDSEPSSPALGGQ